MSKQTDRENVILETLKHKTKLNTLEVVELLSVSESTARRLFSELEQQGKVIRNYGGIQLAQDNQVDYSFEQLAQINVREKRNIASFAVDLIENYDIIYIDSGTTLYQFCIALAERIEKGKLIDVTILTNSMANHQILAPICNVVLIGGEYRPKRMDFAGYASNRFIQLFSFTKCFLGVDGIHLDDGLMATDVDTASLVEIASKRSDKTIVLADSSKLGKRSFVSYAPLETVDILVTAESVDQEIILKLKQKIAGVHQV